MTALVVSGARGRLGGRILALARATSGFEVRRGLVRAGGPDDGHEREGIPMSNAWSPARGEVLVEAGPTGPALEHGDAAADAGVPILLATTGFRAADQLRIEGWGEKVPLVVAPNLSLGVNLMLDLVRRASKALESYDLEILELHHRRKRDAPSGTAIALARAAADGRGQTDFERRAVYARAGDIGPRSDEEIGMMALRGGDIIGEHTVFLVGETERVELTHRAAHRDAFAHGALVAARFLERSAPGCYRMADVLGL